MLAARMVKFLQANGYIDESVQKAGIPGIPGCIEHAYTIWNTIQETKVEKGNLSVVWLDLANAYGSVPHKLLQHAMEHFWIPEDVQSILKYYYDNFLMRFSTGSFTTEWTRLEVGIAAGCSISVVLFILVMEMILKSTDTSEETTLIKNAKKAFMDDITVMSRSAQPMSNILDRLDELIAWSRMRFKAKKSRSVTFKSGKQVETKYKIAGEIIPTVKEEPVKSLGRWYEGTLNDRGRGMELFHQLEEGLINIDKTKLPGRFKIWCLQHALYPRMLWPLMMYEVAITRVEKMEMKCNVFIRKWLGLPKMMNTSAIYNKTGSLQLPIAAISEEFKCAKVRTVMMLRESRDQEIRDDPPEVKTFSKWKAEAATDEAIEILKHKDIIGHTQTDRLGLGQGNFKAFSAMTTKERRNAAVCEVKRIERGKRALHLVKCAQQGQCTKWEEKVIPRRITWRELWNWTPARTSFLLRATYDTLPSPANLVRWKIAKDDMCACGNNKGTLKHILTSCPWGLNKPIGSGRYLWRHNQVLELIVEALEKRFAEMAQNNSPLREIVRARIPFVRQGQKNYIKPGQRKVRLEDEWEGKWKVQSDLDGNLSLPFIDSQLRPDLIITNEERRIIKLIELTVCWEDNIDNAHERKMKRYDDLVDQYLEEGIDAECITIEIGARGFIGHRLRKLLKRVRMNAKDTRTLNDKIQKKSEECSFWIWLKRNDKTWLDK